MPGRERRITAGAGPGGRAVYFGVLVESFPNGFDRKERAWICAGYAHAVFRRARSGTKWITSRRLSAALIRWSILSECPV